MFEDEPKLECVASVVAPWAIAKIKPPPPSEKLGISPAVAPLDKLK